MAVISTSGYADVVVVVSAKSSVTSLTKEQAARIFLGKVDTFPNGENAMPIDQPEGYSIRNEFYAKIANKNSSQLKAYWSKVIFTGDGQPPKLEEGNEAVKNSVANNPNAIGYIDKSTLNGSVKVILEIRGEDGDQ